MKLSKKFMAMTTLVSLLPMLVGIFLYNQLPSKIASHFDAAGNVNGYMTKWVFVFIFPIGMALLTLFVEFMMNVDPKGKNYPLFIKQLISWFVPILMLVLDISIYFYSLGKTVRIDFIVGLIISVLFIVLGNYLPKVGQNYTVGIKLPWTLNNVDNWRNVNRLAGKLMFVLGIVIFFATLLSIKHPNIVFTIITVGTVLICVVPTVYSYLLYKKEEGHEK
jgi:uncharacterized membrane protein